MEFMHPVPNWLQQASETQRFSMSGFSRGSTLIDLELDLDRFRTKCEIHFLRFLNSNSIMSKTPISLKWFVLLGAGVYALLELGSFYTSDSMDGNVVSPEAPSVLKGRRARGRPTPHRLGTYILHWSIAQHWRFQVQQSFAHKISLKSRLSWVVVTRVGFIFFICVENHFYLWIQDPQINSDREEQCPTLTIFSDNFS